MYTISDNGKMRFAADIDNNKRGPPKMSLIEQLLRRTAEKGDMYFASSEAQEAWKQISSSLQDGLLVHTHHKVDGLLADQKFHSLCSDGSEFLDDQLSSTSPLLGASNAKADGWAKQDTKFIDDSTVKMRPLIQYIANNTPDAGALESFLIAAKLPLDPPHSVNVVGVILAPFMWQVLSHISPALLSQPGWIQMALPDFDISSKSTLLICKNAVHDA